MDARITTVLLAGLLVLLAGCAGEPRPEPYRLEAIGGTLDGICVGVGTPVDGRFLPGGLAVVRDQGHETIVTSVGNCVVSIDSSDGTVTRLKAAGEFAATAIDVTATAIFLASRTTGVVMWIDPKTGSVVQALGGFQRPLGARLAPGNTAYVAEFDLGRIVRVRPTPESEPAVVTSGLAGPVDVIVTDPSFAYVTEMTAGQLTRVGLQSESRKVIRKNLKLPQGMARLPDGRIAVVEAGLHRIIAVDVNGGSEEVLFENIPIATPDGSPPDHYAALGLGADGVLYLISDVHDRLLKLAPPATGARH